MIDTIKDLTKHITATGNIPSVLVEHTKISGMDDQRTVVFQAEMNQFDGFEDTVVGMGNTQMLSGILSFHNSDSSVTLNHRTKGDTTQVDHWLFDDANGNTDQYRFMSKEIAEQTIQKVSFREGDWDLTIEPDRSKVTELAQLASVYGGIEPNFQMRVENNNLVVTAGAADGSFTGRRTFHESVNSTYNQTFSWPLNTVLQILRLGMGSETLLQISNRGAMQIQITTDWGKYRYILPSMSI